MLHLINETPSFRGIARLFGAYNVVLVDLPMIDSRSEETPAYPTTALMRTKMPIAISNQIGLNVRPVTFEGDRLMLNMGVSSHPRDPLSLYVLSGLHTLNDLQRDQADHLIRGFHECARESERLLVLTDSLFVQRRPHGFAQDPNVAVVHINGD